MSTRSRSIAIVGAGFSGAALAYRLLRRESAVAVRIVLIEKSTRFGRGLAYSESAAGTTLNVPASRMSIDETRPNDLLDYLRLRQVPVEPGDFIPRTLYGDYVEARLKDAARVAAASTSINRVNRAVTGVTRQGATSSWNVEFDDGSSVLADAVVLATGHCPPRPLAPFASLQGTELYLNDPWSPPFSAPSGGRVLLVGTGLTMADVVCRLATSAHPPREIVALSRRGLLPLSRCETAPLTPSVAIGLDRLERATTLGAMVAGVRAAVRRAAAVGIDWRDVMVALRERVPGLWRRLNDTERARFLRHLQPYWDVHRHQLPPLTGRTLQELLGTRRLSVRAGRITDAKQVNRRVQVTFRPRGGVGVETELFDLVINSSGADADPSQADSPLMRTLLANGLVSADPTRVGLRVDACSRLIGADGTPSPGLHYLGPWLRARDLECTAVHELRLHASALAARLVPAVPATVAAVGAWPSIRQDATRRSTRTIGAAVTVK